MGLMTVRELNANVSQALARAEAGEVLSITRNGKAIAEMHPAKPVRDDQWHAAKARLEELWQQRWGHGTAGNLTEEDKRGQSSM